jgi:hypothetical protein
MAVHNTPLEQQVVELQKENQTLRERVTQLEARHEAAQEARRRLLRGGWRVLLPLVDRQRVARSFARLAQTVSDFTEPHDRWPTKDQVLADARDFMESCVRFVIRRRLFILVFSLIAASVPLVQLWLISQQNEIIQNQNALAEVQVYGLVARSMTQGDRNARQMTGALLANAKLEFLSGVLEEAFAPGQQDVYGAKSVSAAQRRLEDAAFRGYLVRSLSRIIEKQEMDGPVGPSELHAQVRDLVRLILQDGAARLPQVLWLGRQTDAIDDGLAEQVDNYMVQLGSLLRAQGRLARSVGKEDQFFSDVRPLFRRLAARHPVEPNRFAEVYRTVMQDFLFDTGQASTLGEADVDFSDGGTTPEKALSQGLKRLRQGLGAKAVNWRRLEKQLAFP